MNTPTLIKHESPAGPYWYHPDHPLCQDGKVLWEDHVECTGCEGRGEVGGQIPDGSYQTDPCPFCDGAGFVAVELPSGTESQTHNASDQSADGEHKTTFMKQTPFEPLAAVPWFSLEQPKTSTT